MQQPIDQSVHQRKDVPGQYLVIALAAGLYEIYFPAVAFDLPTQSVLYEVKLTLKENFNEWTIQLFPRCQNSTGFQS